MKSGRGRLSTFRKVGVLCFPMKDFALGSTPDRDSPALREIRPPLRRESSCRARWLNIRNRQADSLCNRRFKVRRQAQIRSCEIGKQRLPARTSVAMTFVAVRAWASGFDGTLHKDISSVNARLADECSLDGPDILIHFRIINPKLATIRRLLFGSNYRCSTLSPRC